jgi:hypothetical protein
MNKSLDELSEALDRINIGQVPQTTDQELSELLEVAALLRKSDLPVRPPEHILTGIIDQATDKRATAEDLDPSANLRSIADFPVGRKNRRTLWVYSGVLGAAAALLVFFGIHGFPEIQDVAKEVSSTVVKTPKPEIERRKDSSPPPAPSSTPVTPPTPIAPPASRSVAPSVAPSVSDNSPSAAVPSFKSKPNSTPPNAQQSSAAPLAPLRFPDRTADSITQDPATGNIHQIFDKGTAQELIITQRLQPQKNKSTVLRPAPQTVPEIARKDSAGTISLNKLTVIIHGQEVTLEGRQSMEELRQLAKLLTP